METAGTAAAKLDRAARAMNGVVDAIIAIAEQVDLLAPDATIEAARAGRRAAASRSSPRRSRPWPDRRRRRRGGSPARSEQGTPPCIVPDISGSGAKLALRADLRLPDTVVLHIGGRPPRTCRVVRQTAEEVGVRFL
ncbi:PilZ domain-containing protein [Methylobacterium sp. ID0610]|uniref:PilZ domain-containing protein n=1 Tax=Methylobacterium carpenticola TaxID=3344827 RepID=UPI003676D244